MEPDCEQCQSYTLRIKEEEAKTEKLSVQADRLTDKINLIRRLQEVGVVKDTKSASTQFMTSIEQQENCKGIQINGVSKRQENATEVDDIAAEIGTYVQRIQNVLDKLENKASQPIRKDIEGMLRQLRHRRMK